MKSARALLLRRFGKILAAVLIIVLSLTLLLGLGSQVFSIKNVEVVGEGIRVVIDEQKMIKNLFFFPSDALRAQLLLEYPILESVEIRKKFPHTLVVIAHKRRPIVRIDSPELRYLIAEGGIVVGYASGSEQLPIGYLQVRSYAVGEVIEEQSAVAFISFVENIADTTFVHSARPHDGASLQLTTGTTNIFIPQVGDFEAKASTLQTLMAGFRIKGTLPAVIDLRFDKPIVTF